jgi:hypothetical protein
VRKLRGVLLNRNLLKYLVIGIVCCIIIGVYIYLTVAPTPPTPITKNISLAKVKLVQHTIKTKVEEITVHYEEKLYLSKNDFLKALEDKEKFSLNLIKNLTPQCQATVRKWLILRLSLTQKRIRLL